MESAIQKDFGKHVNSDICESPWTDQICSENQDWDVKMRRCKHPNLEMSLID